MRNVELAGPTDFAGFRGAARMLLTERVPPEYVSFRTTPESGSLFGDDDRGKNVDSTDELKVPRAFVELAHKVSLHSDPARFALLYRLLWRLRTEPRLLTVEVDEDVAIARAWRKSVERDVHKMHAYVRFRAIKGVDPRAFVAWFEPTHHIVEEAAPFFVRRFPNVYWSIRTPERSAIWDTRELRFAAGGRRADIPANDATEDLWRSYFSSIFNPARLNVRAMASHMPKKYWRNLPESSAIPELVRSAAQRTRGMIDAPATAPAKHHRGAQQLAARKSVEQSTAQMPADTSAPDKLSALAEQARHCRNCELWRSATQTVFGEGPAIARVVFVGEQPGDQEDISGAPFVGPAGKLLDRALRDAGVQRADVYVTNAVKHFKFEPRGKRRLHKTPAQREVAACRGWLERELAVIAPELIVALGGTAARSLRGGELSVHSSRGRILDGPEVGGAALLVTVHPSYVLRLPETDKEAAYRAFVADLMLVARFLSRSRGEIVTPVRRDTEIE